MNITVAIRKASCAFFHIEFGSCVQFWEAIYTGGISIRHNTSLALFLYLW